MFIANVGEKVTKVAVIKAIYDNGGYIPGRENWRNTWAPTTYTSWCYVLEDTDGNQIIWKTSNLQYVNDSTPYKKNDTVLITGTCKAQKVSTKNVDQTVLTRCKMELVSSGMTEEEEIEMKQKEQIANLKECQSLKKMTYREYKKSYADCEVLYKSFYRDDHGYSYITVIVK